MRTGLLVLIISAAVIATACSSAGRWPVAENPAPGSSASVPACDIEPAAIPSIEGLDQLRRVAALEGLGFGHTSMRPLVAMSAGVEQNSDDDWVVEPETPDGLEWVVLSSRYELKPADGNLRYTSIGADGGRCEGQVWVGVADYATNTWRWHWAGEPGWDPDFPPDETNLAMPIPGDCQPVSPDGYIYMACAAYGWSIGKVRENPTIAFEYDTGFLAPPVLARHGEGRQLAIDAGPDIDAAQCSGLQVWRCEGESFDPVDYSNMVLQWVPLNVPATWLDVSADTALTYTYALALKSDLTGPSNPLPASPFSNTITVYGE